MMHVLRNAKIWTLGLVVTALVAAPAAEQGQPAPGVLNPQGQTYVVGRAQPPVEPGRPVVNLTLEQAMELALEKNLDLQSARLNPQNVDYQLQAVRTSFLPTYTASYSYGNATSPSNNTLDGVNSVTSGSQGFNANANQNLPWFGSSASVQFTNGRSTTNNITARLNPSYSTRLAFSYNQPLLRGLRIDNTRNQLRTLSIQRQIADTQLLTTIENTKRDVRTAYWQLRQTIEQIEIARLSLGISQQQFEDSKIRVEIGTAAPIDTAQFEVGLASSEQTLLSATINWRTAELNLKRLLVSGSEDALYNSTINPTEQPVLSVQSVDIPGNIQRALAERNDIVQARRNYDVSELNLEVTKDQTRPQLTMSTSFNTSGQGGRQFQNGVVINPGGYNDALKALGSFDTSGWSLGLNLQLPFGQTKQNADIALARAELTMQQTRMTLKSQELTITAEVTNAGLAVENSYKQFQQAQKSREAQERTTDAATTRNTVGLATNFEVVQQQNSLTNSRLTELSRLIAYLNAVAEFDRVVRIGR